MKALILDTLLEPYSSRAKSPNSSPKWADQNPTKVEPSVGPLQSTKIQAMERPPEEKNNNNKHKQNKQTNKKKGGGGGGGL